MRVCFSSWDFSIFYSYFFLRGVLPKSIAMTSLVSCRFFTIFTGFFSHFSSCFLSWSGRLLMFWLQNWHVSFIASGFSPQWYFLCSSKLQGLLNPSFLQRSHTKISRSEFWGHWWRQWLLRPCSVLNFFPQHEYFVFAKGLVSSS